MVESAIYIPLIILCVMFVIYVMIDMYSVASLQAHLHIAVRAESGLIAEVAEAKAGQGDTDYDRYRAAAFAKTVKLSEGKSGGAVTAQGSVAAKYGAGRLVSKVKVSLSARAYAIKETGGIRGILRR
jgi:Flp pilus assembly protein TadG